MNFQEVFEVVLEILAEKRQIHALTPGGSVQLPPIKQGSGTDRLIFHVTVEKPAS